MSSGLAPEQSDLVQRLIAEYRDVPGGLMPLLHAMQAALGHVPPDALGAIAKGLNLSRAEVHGVVTYYHFFRSEPAGRRVVQVCRAESCQAMGADALIADAERLLGCKAHHRRDDGAVTLEPAYCLGLCAMSPALMIDEVPYARMNADKLAVLVAKLGLSA